MAKRYYPAFLDLEGLPATVVGGGDVAAGKVAGLLEAGASVTVVSPSLSVELKDLAAKGAIQWRAKEHENGDLADSRIAIAATDSAVVNEAVAAEARGLGILVNVVDSPARCTFIAPGLVRRGDLTLAVSTGGKSPAVARRVREELEQLFPEEYGALLEVVGHVRTALRDEGLKVPADLWRRALAGDVFPLIQEGRLREAESALAGALRDGVPQRGVRRRGA